eukprot:1066602-Pyramimonas_sp.AAC.1
MAHRTLRLDRLDAEADAISAAATHRERRLDGSGRGGGGGGDARMLPRGALTAAQGALAAAQGALAAAQGALAAASDAAQGAACALLHDRPLHDRERWPACAAGRRGGERTPESPPARANRRCRL